MSGTSTAPFVALSKLFVADAFSVFFSVTLFEICIE